MTFQPRTAAVTSFEFPLVERTRTLLRLEQVYQRLVFFIGQDETYSHHAALMALFEVLEAAGRTELKSDLLQELERQKLGLESLRDNPVVQQDVLEQQLDEIERTMASLLDITGKFGQHLRENEWLMTIKQRAVIPGGTCQFDLPSYHLWLQRDSEQRRADLQRWSAPLMPTARAANILLKLLRDSGKTHQYHARRGAFQQMSGGKVVQLIRIGFESGLPLVPEVSANKYAINVRFIHAATGEVRARQVEDDVEFSLTYCKF